MPDNLTKILQFSINSRVKKFYQAINNPIESQQQILRYLLKKANDTEIGKKKYFNEIKDYAEYSRRLEICDYNSYQPIIERITKGEQNVLWPGKIDWFAKSSGTSESKSKYIPISIDALKDCHFKAGKDL